MQKNKKENTHVSTGGGIADVIENVFGLDQKLILKILNISCLFLALISFTMSYVAYQYNEMLHLKLLLSLAILLVIFSGLIFWYVPKFEELLRESSKFDENDIKEAHSKRKDD
ncbi:putative integral membrane protein [Cryptosporidium felis]|nr:putative integral membrane protein [Cryptosporidium felis]